MTDRERRGELPLPSEDTGDLVDEPAAGQTDDYLVAREEGVPYVPPTDRVIAEPRADADGPDAAAAPRDDEEALSDDLASRALAALRASDLVAGSRLSVGAVGSTLHLRGELESVDVLDEVLAILGEVDGAEEVVDETTVRGL